MNGRRRDHLAIDDDGDLLVEVPLEHLADGLKIVALEGHLDAPAVAVDLAACGEDRIGVGRNAVLPDALRGRMQRGRADMSGERDILEMLAPSRIGDRQFREWWTRAGRFGAL